MNSAPQNTPEKVISKNYSSLVKWEAFFDQIFLDYYIYTVYYYTRSYKATILKKKQRSSKIKSPYFATSLFFLSIVALFLAFWFHYSISFYYYIYTINVDYKNNSLIKKTRRHRLPLLNSYHQWQRPTLDYTKNKSKITQAKILEKKYTSQNKELQISTTKSAKKNLT